MKRWGEQGAGHGLSVWARDGDEKDRENRERYKAWREGRASAESPSDPHDENGAGETSSPTAGSAVGPGGHTPPASG